MLHRVARILSGRDQIGMAIVVSVLRNGWTVPRKAAGDEFSNYAAEVCGHQHVFNPRQVFPGERRIHDAQEIREVHHRATDVLDRYSIRDRRVGIEVLNGGFFRSTRRQVRLFPSHANFLLS
ncbi:MAG: hypothetical protein ACRD27_04695 [Terracidiphilus sp.]